MMATSSATRRSCTLYDPATNNLRQFSLVFWTLASGVLKNPREISENPRFRDSCYTYNRFNCVHLHVVLLMHLYRAWELWNV
jgi:hypothetical protein